MIFMMIILIHTGDAKRLMLIQAIEREYIGVLHTSRSRFAEEHRILHLNGNEYIFFDFFDKLS